MKRKKADELLAQGRGQAERGELAAAEATYRKALVAAPDHLGVYCLLGLLLVDRDDADAAVDLLERARAQAPDFPPLQLALGTAYAAAGHDELATAAMETAIKLDSSSTLPLERLAKHHIRAGRTREAIGLLRRIVRRDPTHAQAPFLLAGLTGDHESTRVDAPPPELIAELFDTYSTSFEQHLTEKLAYNVPKELVALVGGDADRVVIDLGCGTGLAGIELRPLAKRLVGSDLSPRMVARARRRGIYDELSCEDLVATLARARDVDLVVAADVFIYVGALEATFAACATALRPGGVLAFSVEHTEREGFVLQPTLRYAHAETYIRGLAAAHGFVVDRTEPSVLRVDNGRPVHGQLFVLRLAVG